MTKEIVRPFTFELNALKEDIQQELGLSGDKGLHNVLEDLPGK